MTAGPPDLLLLALAAVVAAVLLAVVLVRRMSAAPRGGRPAPDPAADAASRPAAGAEDAPHSAAAEAPDAGAAVPSPFLPAPEGAPDDLRRIKGIGPKLARRLNELGVFHYRQIAAWTPEQLALVDAQLGPFQGRPLRDQWQSQARFLAAGDIRGYEAAHGRLGPDD